MQSARLAIGATRQTEMVKGLEDAHALQMIQARGVRCQRMLGILQYATPSATYPELARLLVLRVRGTLYVHELHLNLQGSGMERDYSTITPVGGEKTNSPPAENRRAAAPATRCP